ncbi:methionine S-methyltransferase-like [Eucalyptus grandis]|uniref:methionine S-methyltransferase-like n=1 Tax=Eucalyptus grandis TaxID=71139 RepID=UPI00192ED310|nr:methionine S-methyltransferase-like [Eucalyptus grandis]
MVDAFQSFPGLSKPHGTVKYAVKKLLGLRERKAGELMDAVATHIEMLKTRSKRLKETLEENRWDVLEPCAGLSMVAKPSVYLDKTLSIKPTPKDGVCAEEGSTYDIKIDNSNIREALLRSTGLCINSSSWTGIPGYCRFTIALDENEFDQALGCIVKFGSAVSS